MSETTPSASWHCLTLSGRRPAFHTMAPGQDDGDELFRDFDLWLGLSGSCTVRMLGHDLQLRAGRMILIPAGVRVRQFTAPGEELLMMLSHFDCLLQGRAVTNAARYVDAPRLRLSLPGLPPVALVAEVDSAGLSEKLYRIRNRPLDDLNQLALSIVLLEVLRHLRETCLGLAGSNDDRRLEMATSFLEQNLHRQIALADVAAYVHVSEETLGRLFRRHYRVSPIQYLTRLRMARARELLQSRRYNISEVARACGYASLQYFSRTFSRQFQLSPQQYRRQLPVLP